MKNLDFQVFLLKHLKGIGNIGLLNIAKVLENRSLDEIAVEELIIMGNVKKQYLLSFKESYQEVFSQLDTLYQTYLNQSFMSIFHSDYPDWLAEMYNPPIGLFFQGDCSLLKNKCLSVIGARDASSYGIGVTQKIVAGLVSEKYTIVSGLARGIDTFAHKAAISNKGKTIAVIGSGLNMAYPKENGELQHYIGNEHLLLSEYRPDTPPLRHHFPMRNRIIAGVSRGVCVIEAKRKSGTLITAQLALDNGRDVFAVPGDIFSESTTGCHELIQQGAKCVWESHHIIEEIDYF